MAGDASDAAGDGRPRRGRPRLRVRLVLPLGDRCGRTLGAGIDLSANMLARARAEGVDPALRYVQADLDALALSEAAFDLAYSSLALHYVADFARLAGGVRRALRPGRHLVFSIEHPIYMAPSRPTWRTLPDGRTVWPLDSYLREGPRTTDWLVPGVVKHRRTLATTLNQLIEAGFAIQRVEEWKPSEAQLATLSDAVQELDRPMFPLIAAQA